MSTLQALIQSLAIIVIFTLTTCLNYDPPKLPSPRNPLLHGALPPSVENENPWPDDLSHCLPHPPTSAFHDRPISRLLRRFPFLIEIWYFLLTYYIYQFLCAGTAIWISADRLRNLEMEELAKKNAIIILGLEKGFGIDYELGLYRYVSLECKPWVKVCFWYAQTSHTVLIAAFLGYGFSMFKRRIYRTIRRTLALSYVLTFVVLSFYRCTPPRLMPPSFGFGDILHPTPEIPVPIDPGKPLHGPHLHGLEIGDQLTLASMPSLYFGTSLLMGFSVIILGKHWPLRLFATFYPILMLFAVLATANHWLLDCCVSAIVVCVTWLLNRTMLLLRPIEETVFWLLRTEKPKDERQSWQRRREWHIVDGRWTLV